jgi:hypothetical protein
MNALSLVDIVYEHVETIQGALTFRSSLGG